MDIYVINLDRHPQRLAHMTTQLRGLAFHRITAIDGRDLSGPEHRIPGRHRAGQLLTRYERACIASHRIALDAFLQSGARHACILEDDLLISPDFSTFMTDGDWMQAAWDVVKIETTMKKNLVGTDTIAGRDRHLVSLYSFNAGGAGYVVSRAGQKN